MSRSDRIYASQGVFRKCIRLKNDTLTITEMQRLLHHIQRQFKLRRSR